MPSQRYLELAAHAAAIMEHEKWRALVSASRELTRGLMLDDIDAVALAIERARAVFAYFPGRPANETAH